MQWEYKIINPHKDGNPNSEFELNELGKERWELVTVVDRGYKIEAWIFKRRLTSSSNGAADTCEYYTNIHCLLRLESCGKHCPRYLPPTP